MNSQGQGHGAPQWNQPGGGQSQNPQGPQGNPGGHPAHPRGPQYQAPPQYQGVGGPPPWNQPAGPPPLRNGRPKQSPSTTVGVVALIVLSALLVVLLVVFQPWKPRGVGPQGVPVSSAPADPTPTYKLTETANPTSATPKATPTPTPTPTTAKPTPKPKRPEITELVSTDGRFRVQFDEPGWVDVTDVKIGEDDSSPNLLRAQRSSMGISIGGEEWAWGAVTPDTVMDQTWDNGTPPGFVLGPAPLITMAGGPAHGVTMDTGFNYMYVYYLPPEGGVAPTVIIDGANEVEAGYALALLDGKLTRVGE